MISSRLVSVYQFCGFKTELKVTAIFLIGFRLCWDCTMVRYKNPTRVSHQAGMAQWWGRSPITNRFDSRTQCHMWVEFIIGSQPCSERFFLGYSGFLLSGGQQFSQTAYGVCILRDDRDMISLSSVIIRVSLFLNRTVGIDMSKTVRFRATLTLTVTLLMLLGSDHLLWLWWSVKKRCKLLLLFSCFLGFVF